MDKILSTPESAERVIASLQDALGAKNVSIDAGDVRTHSTDRWPALLKAERGAGPLCVVRPHSAADVQTTLRIAGEWNVPIVPFGGGSGVAGAAVPGGPAISLDMKAMDRIVSLDEEDMTVDVESGVMGDRLEAFLNERGYTLGHSPQSLQLSTVGGWISTKATGQFSSRYGGIEDILCTLEAVLPTGGVVSWPRVPRSATGPRLMDIFIGGEGCFGVITRAVLKVMPLPDVRLFRAVAFPSVEEGCRRPFGRCSGHTSRLPFCVSTTRTSLGSNTGRPDSPRPGRF